MFQPTDMIHCFWTEGMLRIPLEMGLIGEFSEMSLKYFDCQGTVVVAGRARAIVVGVGANTAMGSIRDSMLQTEDVSNVGFHSLLVFHLQEVSFLNFLRVWLFLYVNILYYLIATPKLASKVLYLFSYQGIFEVYMVTGMDVVEIYLFQIDRLF